MPINTKSQIVCICPEYRLIQKWGIWGKSWWVLCFAKWGGDKKGGWIIENWGDLNIALLSVIYFIQDKGKTRILKAVHLKLYTFQYSCCYQNIYLPVTSMAFFFLTAVFANPRNVCLWKLCSTLWYLGISLNTCGVFFWVEENMTLNGRENDIS